MFSNTEAFMADNLSEIIEIFSSTTDRREMRQLFEDVFTDAEREDIAKRWYIFKARSSFVRSVVITASA